MDWPKRYDAQQSEETLARRWQELEIYRFQPDAASAVYSIDTPPPSISGHLHLGNVYSYSHTDFVARYRRMRGENVFYPMGFDDNGLPTERLVERRLGIRAADVGRAEFIRHCLEMSHELSLEYRALWQRLGLSIDWRYTYHTIDELSRRTAQLAFIELHRKDLAYRSEAPVIWCPECRTAIAQAEVDDLQRESELVTLAFEMEDGSVLPIATTRPELLPACVAVFVHPGDARYAGAVGQTARAPLFGWTVPVLADEQVQTDKGTGAVMCCTFGDTTDIDWWYTYRLPLRTIIDEEGRLGPEAGRFSGMSTPDARREIVATFGEDQLLGRQRVEQTVRVHERCGTPVEYLVTRQWFIRVLDHKEELLEAGERIRWHPEHMKLRYRNWIENLRWDWLISRQRYYGVPFPVWYCECGETILADESQLPVDPTVTEPPAPCTCGRTQYRPELDVMDTWATSSLSPQIAGQRLADPAFYSRVFPMSLRPQAHEIIRTWAFYTVVQSLYHFGAIPWRDVMISGWGLAPQGSGKISKSKVGGPMAPMEALNRYSADAVRFWAASTALGKDSIISEEKIQAGVKLVNKLWNVAGFASRFLENGSPHCPGEKLTSADRWILATLQHLIERSTDAFERYDYMSAKNDTELFFWRDLCDNYLEMAKRRLYAAEAPGHVAAIFALHSVLSTLLKLLAPLLPYVTDEIYRSLLAAGADGDTIHRQPWPEPNIELVDPEAVTNGQVLLDIATAIRRYKSDHSLSLGAPIGTVHIATPDPRLRRWLDGAHEDLLSMSRAAELKTSGALPAEAVRLASEPEVSIAISARVQHRCESG